MAKRKRTKRNVNNYYKILSVIIALAVLIAGYFLGLDDLIFADGGRVTAPAEGELIVRFIDVGQADSILVMSSDEVMLIDTGDMDDDYTEKIISYIENLGIKEIDYLILTHPDADHIGGAPEIIGAFDIINCIMPDYSKTTKIYENTLAALEAEEGVNVIEATPAYTFTVGEAVCKILAPLDEYKDANDASVVIRLDFGKRSILFTGDAEKESEEDIVAKYSASELKVDVLKSGHHGSRTSSSTELLDKADPDYAVISCGTDNDYGHPHKETIDRYQKYGITVYRTDKQGTVILSIKDDKLNFITEK